MAAIVTLLNPTRRRGNKRRRRAPARRRRGNPHQLLIVNGRRKTSMAARRRRRRRAAPVTNRRRRRANPRRRRRGFIMNRRRRRNGTLLSNPRRRRRRRANPRRRHHRRRRNPGLLSGAGGMLQKGLTAVVGMAVTNFAYGFVAGVNPAGMVGQIGIKLGIAWGLGTVARRFGFSAQADMLTVGGVVSAGQDAFNFFIGGGGLFFPAAASALPPGRTAMPASMTGDDAGISDIVAVPQNWGGLGDIVGTSYPTGWFQ